MKKIQLISNNKGLTLIEILASIVILTIILITFLSMYAHSARTNNVSEKIIDATYVAQSSMEEIYHLSTMTTLDDGMTKIQTDLHYQEVRSNPHLLFEKPRNTYFVTLQLEKVEDNGPLVRILVKVYKDAAHQQLHAQMETVLFWESETGDES